MAKVIVTHRYYGCDSGCCGHVIEVDGCETDQFNFTHPGDDDFRKFAEDLISECLGAEHVKDLDWENCIIVDD